MKTEGIRSDELANRVILSIPIGALSVGDPGTNLARSYTAAVVRKVAEQHIPGLHHLGPSLIEGNTVRVHSSVGPSAERFIAWGGSSVSPAFVAELTGRRINGRLVITEIRIDIVAPVLDTASASTPHRETARLIRLCFNEAATELIRMSDPLLRSPYSEEHAVTDPVALTNAITSSVWPLGGELI